MKNGKLIAIIPVRKNSERIKYKNLKKFGDSSILEIKIKQLKKISLIDDIIVNSDWNEALELAHKLEVKTYKRDPIFASSNTTASDFYKNLAETLSNEYKYVMYAPPTSPLLKNETITNVIKYYFNNINTNDSIVTASNIKKFLWKDNQPINYDIYNVPKSQDLPNIYALNHAIVINSRDFWINNKSLVGKNPIIYKISDIESIDIDDPIDFEIAEFLYLKYYIN